MTAPPPPLDTRSDTVLAGALAFACERIQDGPLVDALVDQAFGPGRYAKTAERLREGNVPRLDLSICAWDGDRLVGTARQWPVLVGDTPALFLGPFAVAEPARRKGLGAALIGRACALADAAGVRLTLLVGDLPYFGPLGFEAAPPGRVIVPGPVDPGRVLWRAGRPDAFDAVAGLVRIPPEA